MEQSAETGESTAAESVETESQADSDEQAAAAEAEEVHGIHRNLCSEGGRIHHRGSGRLCEEDPEEPEQQVGCRA